MIEPVVILFHKLDHKQVAISKKTKILMIVHGDQKHIFKKVTIGLIGL